MAQANSETNIDITIQPQKSSFILFDGCSIYYHFQIYNTNNYTIENLDLQFQLRYIEGGGVDCTPEMRQIVKHKLFVKYSGGARNEKEKIHKGI